MTAIARTARRTETALFLPAITSAGGLAALATKNVYAANQLACFRDSETGRLYTFQLQEGTDTDASPTVFRPVDYAGGTYEVVWRMVGSGGRVVESAENSISNATGAADTEDMIRGDIVKLSTGTVWQFTGNDNLDAADFTELVGAASDAIAGVIRLATRTEQAAGVSETTAVSPRRLRDALVSGRLRRIVFAGLSSASSSGSVQQSTNLLRVNSSGTPSGNAIAFYGEVQLWQGANKGFVKWAEACALRARFTMAFMTTNGVSRVILGKSGTPSVGALAVTGIGFEIRNTALWIIRHDGTTLSANDTGLTLTQNVTYDVEVASNGAGSITAWVNGTAYGPFTGGPTTNTVDNRHFSIETTNGGDAAQHTIDMTSLALYVA